MKIIRLLISFFFLTFTLHSFSQNDYDRSLNELEKVNNLLIDATASFLRYPYNHNNTINVFNQIKKLNAIYKGIQSNRYEVLSKWDHYKVRLFYDTTDKMQALAGAFEDLLSTFAGYASGGVEGAVMENLLEPLFDEAGWEKKMLNVHCQDAYFVEYSYGDFKMMFIKSTRPKNDSNNLIPHNIEVSFIYEGPYRGVYTYYVAGNFYRMVQFKDNENESYRKVVKAKSVRK